MKRNLTTPEAKQAAALEYFHATPTPDQKLCPELLQYFSSSRGTMVWHSKSGKRELYHRTYNQVNNLAPVRSEYDGLYIKYVKNLGALELSHICMAGNRGKEGVPRDWNFAPYGRYLIFAGDTNCYSVCGFIVGKKYYCKELISFIRNIRLCLVSKEAHDELKKFTNGAPVGTKWGDQEWPASWQYAEWYQKSFVPRTQSKQSSDLLSYEFDPIELTRDQMNHYGTIAVFERLDDNYAVLRIAQDVNTHWNWQTHLYEASNNPRLYEQIRIFIDAKGKPTTAVHDRFGWKIQANVGYLASREFDIYNLGEAMTWNPLKYTLPVLPKMSCVHLLAVLRHPIVEQLIKAGYPNTAKMLAKDGRVCAAMKDIFGVEKEKKMPIYKLLGVNKYLLREFEENAKNDYSYSQLITNIKKLYGKFDISDLDESSCKLVCAGFRSEHYSRLRNWVLDSNAAYYWGDFEVTDADRKIILKLFRMIPDNPHIMSLWSDTITTYRGLNNKPDMDLAHFKSTSDLNRMHDALVELKVVEDMERAARYSEQKKKELERYQKDFEKLQKDRIEKYEYTTDQDSFVIRVPHELYEITKEGMALGHCVGGYVNRHASGETNIIFLRKKAEENKPFYTIEIRGNSVIQIHGRHNRWLGNDPEAIPFMYRYLKQLGVHFDPKMLLNCGAGYSASATYLPDTYLTMASA